MSGRFEEREYLYWLCQVPVLGAVKIRKLWETVGSFSGIYNIEENKMNQIRFLSAKEKECLLGYKNRIASCVKEYHSLPERGIQFITPLDGGYPERLRYIYDMPMGLYFRGKLPDDGRPTAAIIGARGCSSYGRQAAEFFGRELSRSGVQIISGLASGIDSAGHWGAIKAAASNIWKEGEELKSTPGKTFGILGCGINICYPRENYGLYEQVAKCGGLITEYRMGEAPQPKNFPIRNRIISGLADVILVMEAKEKSGSLITVEQALEQGKDVFALPGRFTDPLSSGCNALIQSGAGILLSPGEVLEYLGIQSKNYTGVEEKNGKGLAKTEKMVYSCLDLQPKHIEQIVSESGLTVSQCMSALLDLELEGYIIRTANQYYGKRI